VRQTPAQSPNPPGGTAAAHSTSTLDLSGTWVLDKAKSDFGLLPTPSADTSTYTRVGPVYHVVEVNAADTGSSHIAYSWPVGSGEVSSDIPDLEASIQTRVTQHGDTAAFVSQLKHLGKTIEIQSGREYVSPDGKVRTREFDLQSLANPDEDLQHVVAVFQRQ
jgi:hypothetical protein